MQVAYAEFRTWNVYGQEHLGAARQVLDVAITAMLRSPRYGPCAFFTDLLFHLGGGGARVDIVWLGGLRDDAFEFRGTDELGFAAVPFCQDFSAGGTT